MEEVLRVALVLAWCALAWVPLGANASEVEGPGATLVFSDLTFVGSRGATPEVLLSARVARLRRSGDVADLEDVEAHVSGTGEGRLDMRCDRAEYSIDTNDFVAEGHVRGRTGDGRHFQTTRLRYDHAQALATTEVPVVITDVHGRYHGGGFRYHVGQGRFQLVGGATVIQE